MDLPAPATSSRRTTSFLELLDHVLGDWQRTLRLLVLLLTASACLAAILFVLQLHPDRWVSAIAVAASVVAGVLGLNRRREGKDPPEDP